MMFGIVSKEKHLFCFVRTLVTLLHMVVLVVVFISSKRRLSRPPSSIGLAASSSLEGKKERCGR